MSLNDARELGRGSVRQLGELGRGRNEQTHELGAQFVERGQRGKRLHAIDIQDGFAHRAAEDDELLVRLGEFDGNLRRRDRIVRSSNHGRSLQKGTDGGDVSAFKSNLGETVLRDLHRCASLPHLRTQLLHLDDSEAGIVGNDGNVRGLEDLVERYDRVLFCRSFHSKLSPVGGRCPSWSRTTGLHPPSRPSPDSGTRSRKTRRARRHLKACPPEAFWGHRGVEVRTKLNSRRPNGASAKQNPVFTRLCRPY